jgi:hypothetical protein
MKHAPWIAVVLIALAGVSSAQSFARTSDATLRNASVAIQTELESHGSRVMGNDAYSWQTRLENLDGCRVEFSVRTVNNVVDPTVSVETVSFSLGAVDPYSIAFQKHWLQLSCMNEDCIYSTTKCMRRSADGTTIDCSTPNQKWARGFALEMDGNEASALRMQKALYLAVQSCRRPTQVSF